MLEEEGTLRSALGPDGADGVFGKAVTAQAEIEGEAIRAGLIEAFGAEAPQVEVVVEWEEVVIRCVGVAQREDGDEVVAALEEADAGIRERIGRVGAAAVEAARTGDGFWTLEAEAFAVEVVRADEAMPVSKGVDEGLVLQAQWLLVPRLGLFSEPPVVPRFGPLRGARLAPHTEADGQHSAFKTDPDTGVVTKYEEFRPQSNPRNPNPWESVKRYDSAEGKHFNKSTQEHIPVPHVHDPTTPGGIRRAEPREIPGTSK